MTPHFFIGHNRVFKAPPDWDHKGEQGECSDLPVLIDAEGITSVWKPSAEELAALVAGGGVCITICQHVQPVMALGVVTADCLQVSV